MKPIRLHINDEIVIIDENDCGEPQVRGFYQPMIARDRSCTVVLSEHGVDWTLVVRVER